MRSTLKTSLPLLTILVLLMALVTPLGAANSLKVTLPAGETQLSVGGKEVLVTASGPVVIYIAVNGNQVYGVAEPPHGSNSNPFVSIVLLGEPNETIFLGKVLGPTPFDSLKPHETGHVDL